MKAVCETSIPLHLLNRFFLVFALLLSYCQDLAFLSRIFCGLCPAFNHLAWVNAHMDSFVIGLFSLQSFSVDDVFLPVHLDQFAYLLTFVVSSDNLNLIILSNGHRLNIVLLPQLFGKGGRHTLPPNMRRCTEMPFVVLASVRSHKGPELHFGGCNPATILFKVV